MYGYEFKDSDTLIFCGEEDEQLRYRVILVLFEGISGLHINWRKSFLYPINEEHNMEALNIIPEKRYGGLGIKNLQNHSKALRMKWLWKYANDKHPLRRKVIKAKYEE
ncbi:hypothetical protein H5410_015448 [Solanum commersonii]|uniref:Reverse transcriptase domain-containing protein n=1 Tax=Solanum commersonii TaxID=4109 RepID=A0A9J5ZTV5_SOLCO|nr:hypothetical protein H5410_015448 [Solanum commersonii]